MIPARWFLLSGVVFTLIFLAFPEIDLWASGQFFQPGERFALLGIALFDGIHRHLELPLWFFLAFSLIYLIAAGWSWSPAWLGDKRKQVAYILLTLVIGPGLLVNTVFKDNWGRARPMDVVAFEGDKQFSPPWVPSNQCQRNCSFVCGDASVGFSLVALAFISRRPRRWLVAAMITGGALGLMRIGQGGHFLSDVIFSFYIVYFAAWLLHRWMFGGQARQPEG